MTSDYIKSLEEYKQLSGIRFERFYRNKALGLECEEEINNTYTQELCQNGCIMKKDIDLAKLQKSPFSLFEDKESHYLLWLCHCIKYEEKSLLAWINDYINNISGVTRGGINTYKRNGWSVHVLYVYQLVHYNFAYNVLPVAFKWDFDAKSIISSFGNEYRKLSSTAKFILKIACFIHDIGVQIAVNDHESLGVSLVEESYSMLEVTSKDFANNGFQFSTKELIYILQVIVGNHQLINQVAAEVSDYMIYEKICEIKNKAVSDNIKKFIFTEFSSVMYLLGASDMMAVDDSLLSEIKFDEISEAKEYIQRVIVTDDYIRDYKKYGIKRLKCFVNDKLKEASDKTINAFVRENGYSNEEILKFMYEVQGISYGVAAIKPLNDLELSIKFIIALYRIVTKSTIDYKNVLIKIDSGFRNEYIRQLLLESIEIIDKKLNYKLIMESTKYIFTVRLM